ncbi:hypothetical protein, partial [Pseudomonas syringae]|uniref:hypothetical protein n=1 Tax=Pseudomonas syringae TaxID=317 RepID=UPI003204A165
ATSLKPALPAQYSCTAASFACSVYLPMMPPKVVSNLRGSYHSSVGMHVVTLCVTGPEGAGNGIFFIFIYGITK